MNNKFKVLAIVLIAALAILGLFACDSGDALPDTVVIDFPDDEPSVVAGESYNFNKVTITITKAGESEGTVYSYKDDEFEIKYYDEDDAEYKNFSSNVRFSGSAEVVERELTFWRNGRRIGGTVIIKILKKTVKEVTLAVGDSFVSEYYVGETLNTSGLVMTVSFNEDEFRNKNETIYVAASDLDSTSYNMSAAGTYDLVCMYNGTRYTTATTSITVSKRTLAVPTLETTAVTADSVTLNTIADAKYILLARGTAAPDKESEDWQTTATFGELNPATEYVAYAYIIDNNYHFGTDITTGLDVTTDKQTLALPTLELVSNEGGLTFKNQVGAEFEVGTIVEEAFVRDTNALATVEGDNIILAPLEANSDYTVRVRFPETATSYATEYVSGAFSTGKDVGRLLAKDIEYVYNGQLQVFEYNIVGVSGLTDEDFSIAYANADDTPLTTAPKAAGTYKVTVTYTGEEFVIGALATQYTVQRAPLTVSANNKVITYGDELPSELTFSTGTMASGDTLSGSLAIDDVSVNAGSYDIVIGSLANPNYDITFTKGILTINKKELAVTLTPLSLTKVYGSLDDIRYTVGELMYEDVSTTAVTGAITREAGEDVGTYEIDTSGLVSTNYELVFSHGAVVPDYVITKKPITVVADDISKKYGSVDPTLTFHLGANDLVSGDVIADEMTVVLTREIGEDVIYRDAGVYNDDNYDTYAITMVSFDSANYSATFVEGAFTVQRKDVKIIVDAKTQVYGEAQKELTSSFESGKAPIEGETLVGSLGLYLGANETEINAKYADAAHTRLAATEGVSATITILANFAAADNPNYKIESTPATYIVSKKPITITPIAATYTYGDYETMPLPTHEPFETGDIESGDTINGNLSRSSTTANAGTYRITIGNMNTVNPNYNFILSSDSVTYVIERRVLTLDYYNYSNLVYNGNDQGFTRLTSTEYNAMTPEDKLADNYCVVGNIRTGDANPVVLKHRAGTTIGVAVIAARYKLGEDDKYYELIVELDSTVTESRNYTLPEGYANLKFYIEAKTVRLIIGSASIEEGGFMNSPYTFEVDSANGFVGTDSRSLIRQIDTTQPMLFAEGYDRSTAVEGDTFSIKENSSNISFDNYNYVLEWVWGTLTITAAA